MIFFSCSALCELNNISNIVSWDTFQVKTRNPYRLQISGLFLEKKSNCRPAALWTHFILLKSGDICFRQHLEKPVKLMGKTNACAVTNLQQGRARVEYVKYDRKWCVC